MKIILIGIGSLFTEHIRAAEELAKNHKILYWVRLEDFVSIDTSKFPDTTFHDYRDALKNIPPGAMRTPTPAPWSAKKIAEHFETESELMPMMDKWYPDWPILKRKDFFYDSLSYWGSVLRKYSPDAIIFHAPPHEMFSYVLYRIAQKRGIPTPMFDCILGQDRVILCDDYKYGNKKLAQEAAGGFQDGAGEMASLSKEMQSYYKEISSAPAPIPQYVESWKVEALGWGKFRRRTKALVPFIKDGTIFERAVMRVFKILKAGVLDEQKKHEKPADFSKPYIYVPLHYQPECTTSPQGGIFVDQILMIKMLASALPEGWEIYVKEHPAQEQAHGNEFTPYRYRGFFGSIADIPKVRLVPTNTNTFELTRRSKTVATIAGTAAWEAVLRGKPALVFGYPWFMHAPGVFRVSSSEECADAFKRIDNGFVSDTKVLLNYLARVEQSSFRGYTSGYGKKIAKLSAEEAISEMHRALESALTK